LGEGQSPSIGKTQEKGRSQRGAMATRQVFPQRPRQPPTSFWIIRGNGTQHWGSTSGLERQTLSLTDTIYPPMGRSLLSLGPLVVNSSKPVEFSG